MAQVTDVVITKKIGLDLEVSVGYNKPAAIGVALYGPNRKLVKDLGSALSMEPPDPDVFKIATKASLKSLHKHKLYIRVAIGSFSAEGDESVSVHATLRQGSNPVESGTVMDTQVVKNGGGASIIVFNIEVT